MKFSILLLSFIIFSIVIKAQYIEKDEVKYFASDQIIIDLNYNHWEDESNSVGQEWNSIGCGIYAIYNLIGKYSNICLAGGFGINMQNINLSTQPDETSAITVFYQIPDGTDYKKNKIALTYAEIPLEIRIRSNPNTKQKSFKLYLGTKFGYLINNHLKYEGEDPTTGEWIKYKTYNLPNISYYSYGITGRIGFGKIHKL